MHYVVNDDLLYFVQTFEEMCEWRYGIKLDAPCHIPETVEYEDLNGRLIQSRRAENLVANAWSLIYHYGPWLIGIDAPRWIWSCLTDLMIKNPVPTSHLTSFNFIEYDKSKPGVYYSGNRMMIKLLFADNQNVENMGQKIDGTAVASDIFEAHATHYLVCLFSQAAQVVIKRAQEAQAEGTQIVVEAAEGTDSPDAAAKDLPVSETPRDHQGKDSSSS